jgi:hypothetical protein
LNAAVVSGQRLNRRQDTPRRSAAAENEAQRDADAHRGQNRADWLVLGEILHARHGLPTDILRLPCDLIGFSAELGGRVTHQTAHSVLHPAADVPGYAFNAIRVHRDTSAFASGQNRHR